MECGLLRQSGNLKQLAHYPSTLEVENADAEESQKPVDITDVAIKQLDEQYAGLIAMRAAGSATKAVAADQMAFQP